MATAASRGAAPVTGTIVSTSISEVRWRADSASGTKDVNSGLNGTVNGTNGTPVNGATAVDPPPIDEAEDVDVETAPAAESPAPVSGNVEVPSEMPAKKKRRFFGRRK
jgi:hypothetical protein